MVPPGGFKNGEGMSRPFPWEVDRHRGTATPDAFYPLPGRLILAAGRVLSGKPIPEVDLSSYRRGGWLWLCPLDKNLDMKSNHPDGGDGGPSFSGAGGPNGAIRPGGGVQPT